MSGADRTPWLTATTLDQDFLDDCADNLNCALEMVCEIELPGGATLYASDRNKYVGDKFYEALVTFPTIDRTMGEWLSNETEFSTLTLNLSNVDGRFNPYLPSGASFGGWVGKRVTVKLGLRDVAATYRTIFRGRVTDIGGFGRSTTTINVIARDETDKLAAPFPQAAFTVGEYPAIESDKEGTLIPFVLGDWTTGLTSLAGVPAIQVNGNDPNVYGGSRNNVQFVVSINALSFFDPLGVCLRRNSTLYPIDPADIVNINADKNKFELVQGGATSVDGAPYQYDTGDEVFVRVGGPLLSGNQGNAVAQAKHILETYLPGAVTFGSSWTSYAAKASPAQSAIATIQSRVWIQQPQPILTYVKSLLQQVRLEAFFDANLELALTSNHYEDWASSPSFIVKNWDVEQGSFQTAVDERNVFNRAQGAFSFEPSVDENAQTTGFFKSTGSISQIGRVISKQLVFPNLYVRSDVENQVREILKLACACPENITYNATWRSLLQDLGGMVALNVQIGPATFASVPCRLRSIGYQPDGLKLACRLMSLQMFPFGSWLPGYAGIVGGQNATIAEE